ncbi:hypothetical protein CLV42_105261 [Chitinophaga ginsengisoli]|uniref:Uncharacterized protein n=1 Tax=Chitinophaga ginsengisoli TaxID=363837 RepID=A0A2P8GA96_9BACT|nr:hypothetical protein CLV42_105261 [Chitinophaga ginsengisoli]
MAIRPVLFPYNFLRDNLLSYNLIAVKKGILVLTENPHSC